MKVGDYEIEVSTQRYHGGWMSVAHLPDGKQVASAPWNTLEAAENDVYQQALMRLLPAPVFDPGKTYEAEIVRRMADRLLESSRPFGHCECSDPGCKACYGQCSKRAKTNLIRVDMDDRGGTLFCDACADDALASGIYREDRGAYIRATTRNTRPPRLTRAMRYIPPQPKAPLSPVAEANQRMADRLLEHCGHCEENDEHGTPITGVRFNGRPGTFYPYPGPTHGPDNSLLGFMKTARGPVHGRFYTKGQWFMFEPGDFEVVLSPNDGWAVVSPVAEANRHSPEERQALARGPRRKTRVPPPRSGITPPKASFYPSDGGSGGGGGGITSA